MSKDSSKRKDKLKERQKRCKPGVEVELIEIAQVLATLTPQQEMEIDLLMKSEHPYVKAAYWIVKACAREAPMMKLRYVNSARSSLDCDREYVPLLRKIAREIITSIQKGEL